MCLYVGNDTFDIKIFIAALFVKAKEENNLNIHQQ